MRTDAEKDTIHERGQIEKGDTYAALVERQIEALFAASRDAEGDEIGPYAQLRRGQGTECFSYVSFRSRAIGENGVVILYVNDAYDDCGRIVEAVKRLFPDHATQRLIWRRRPVFEVIPAQKASKKLGIEAEPAAQQIYCRLVGVPMDAEFVGKWRNAD